MRAAGSGVAGVVGAGVAVIAADRSGNAALFKRTRVYGTQVVVVAVGGWELAAVDRVASNFDAWVKGATGKGGTPRALAAIAPCILGADIPVMARVGVECRGKTTANAVAHGSGAWVTSIAAIREVHTSL